MAEVALLFVAIFITIAPVLRMLEAGGAGPFAPVLALLRDGQGNPSPGAFFWLTGLLSAFLDNAPTYLVFFGLGDVRPETLDGARNVPAGGGVGGGGFLRRAHLYRQRAQHDAPRHRLAPGRADAGLLCLHRDRRRDAAARFRGLTVLFFR